MAFLNFEVVLSLLDITALSGYKFVGSVINIAIGLAFGSTAFYVSFFINSLMFCIFMGKTLRATIQSLGIHQSNGLQDLSQDKSKQICLFLWVIFQFVLIYFLCNKGF